MLVASSVGFGLTIGNVLLLQSMLLAEAFGAALYARVYSVGNLLSTAGIAGGPLLLGVLHDVSGYRVAFLGAMAASWVAALLMAVAGSSVETARSVDSSGASPAH